VPVSQSDLIIIIIIVLTEKSCYGHQIDEGQINELTIVVDKKSNYGLITTENERVDQF